MISEIAQEFDEVFSDTKCPEYKKWCKRERRKMISPISEWIDSFRRIFYNYQGIVTPDVECYILVDLWFSIAGNLVYSFSIHLDESNHSGKTFIYHSQGKTFNHFTGEMLKHLIIIYMDAFKKSGL